MSSEDTRTLEAVKAATGKMGAGGMSLAGVIILVILQAFQFMSGADAARDAKLDRVFEIANTTSATVQVIESKLTDMVKRIEKLEDRR